jgi:cell wall assembly regulator SMI1
MTVQEEVVRLLKLVARLRNLTLPEGASEHEIAGLSARLNITIPSELKEWLHSYNGPNIGYGGTFGILPSDPFLDIESHYNYSATWKQKGWIPIAGDGCGDFYVLDTSYKLGSMHPVYFLDQQDFEHPDYVVASGLWSFLRFLLQKEMGHDFWPFEKEEVLEQDPALAEYRGEAPFAWDVADSSDY